MADIIRTKQEKGNTTPAVTSGPSTPRTQLLVRTNMDNIDEPIYMVIVGILEAPLANQCREKATPIRQHAKQTAVAMVSVFTLTSTDFLSEGMGSREFILDTCAACPKISRLSCGICQIAMLTR